MVLVRGLVLTCNCRLISNIFSLALPLPRHRLDGCACRSPLAHFYIHHAQSSVRELHPFTTITHLGSQNAITPQTEDHILVKFLFRKSGRSRSVPDTPSKKHAWATGFGLFNLEAKPKFEWTDRLTSVADQHMPVPEGVDDSVLNQSDWAPFGGQSSVATLDPNHSYRTVDIGIRLEGPYFTPADPSRYKTVICFVAGTGVSGAIAIASSFVEMKRQQAANHTKRHRVGLDCGSRSSPDHLIPDIWERCVIFWSVRADDYVNLPFLKGKVYPILFPYCKYVHVLNLLSGPGFSSRSSCDHNGQRQTTAKH